MSNLFSSGGVTINIYSTPDSMRAKVDEYFDMCFAMKYNKTIGRDVPYVVIPPSYAGLARYLGFKSRQQLLNYANERDEAFADVVADARLRIEEYLEGELIRSKAPTGVMFSLKNNAGWEDKTKQTISGDDDKPLVFGWATDAKDVIDISTENKGVLPTAPLQIESTQDNGSSD